jgi:hypothetical protein
MDGGTDQSSAGRQFDPQRLVAAVNQCFVDFGFTIQTFRPDLSYSERVKAWFAGKAAAESRGLPFDDPAPVLSYTGSATFDRCRGEERESGFVLELSMKAESGRPFTIFIEEDHIIPDFSYRGPERESAMAAQLAFWTAEMICHGTVDDLDGRAVDSGKWLKTWT